MANYTTVDNGTLLSISANNTWQGSITLSATLTTGIGASGVSRYPQVVVSGTGEGWADQDAIAVLALSTPNVLATALSGVSVSQTTTVSDITIQTRETPITLTLSFGGSGVTASATETGNTLF